MQFESFFFPDKLLTDLRLVLKVNLKWTWIIFYNVHYPTLQEANMPKTQVIIKVIEILSAPAILENIILINQWITGLKNDW